jgi:hypothetical protein
VLTLLRIAADETALKSDGGRLSLPASAASCCRLATGRSALFHMIGRLQIEHARTVLLPCYVAEGVIQPFLRAEFQIRFYRLRANLTPMIEDVDALLQRTPGVAVVIVLHYFGFPVRSDELDSVLHRHACVVVDDFAHAPFAMSASGAPLADDSQVALFSLNKVLPVADGAIMVSKRDDIDLSLDESVLLELPKAIQQAYQRHLQAARELFESDNPVGGEKALHELERAYEEYYSGINSDLRPHRQSAHSQRVESAFPMTALIESRRRNSRMVYDGVSDRTFSLVHADLPPGVVPFCIPARVPAARRRQILDELFQQGVMLSTLQDKWDFIPRDRRASYPIEAAFIDEHVLIPVSEFISTEAMREMISLLNSI